MPLPMEPRIPNYLRTHRKRSGLTQDELAFLLGGHTGSQITKYERRTRTPTFRSVLACQVIFGKPPRELFPAEFYKAERTVIKQAQKLCEVTIGKGSSQRMERKIQFLMALAKKRPVKTKRAYGEKQ